MDEASFAIVLDAIYDAAVAPAKWQYALELLSAAFDCSVNTLIDRNIRTMHGSAISTGIDAAGQAEYFSTWTAKNVFIETTPRWTAGSIVTDRQLLPKARLMASDYYNGFLKPRDMHSLLRISMWIDNDVHQSMSMMRPRRAGEFEASDVARCQLFLPHLQRAAKVSRRMSVSEARLQSVNHLLEENSDGIILADHAGRVMFVNRAARAMVEKNDGFTIRYDKFEAMRGETNRAFQKLLSGALGAIADPLAERAGTMRFARLSGAKDYIVTVAPMPRTQAADAKSIPWVCITISDPTAAPKQPLKTLQDLYGLTSAETRVAQHLFAGHTPEKAALALNIKISTARTHIARIFHKTDVRRQSELIGLVLRLR